MTSQVYLIDFLKKRSKSLFREYQSGNAHAKRRIEKVLLDTNSVSLMKAQHVVAVEGGFRNWQELLEADEQVLRLATVMAMEPRLSYFGIGVFDEFSKRREVREAELIALRQELRTKASRVFEVALWLLENVKPIKTLNYDHTSYGLKHVAEDHIGRYVANGEFIAAALIAGYAYKIDRDGPNVHFAMSKKSINELWNTRQIAKTRLSQNKVIEL